MTSPTAGRPSRKRRWPWVALAAVLVLAAAGGYGIYWFLKDDAPPPVSLDTAVAGLTTTAAGTATTAAGGTAAAGDATTATPSGSTDSLAGTWAVDPTLGTFSFDSATSAFAGFRVKENLRGIGSTTAVGRTPDVKGTIVIDGTTLSSASFAVDLTTITTNDSRRNGRVQDALDTGSFPTATFTLTQPVDLGAAAGSGSSVKVQAVGDLTIHGVTKRVTVPIDAKLSGKTIVVVGSLPIVFSDYGVSVPRSPVVVSVDDNGIVELQLLLTRR